MNKKNKNSNENRFTGKADNYGKYRPSYPLEIVPLLQNECNMGEVGIALTLNKKRIS